MEPVILRYITGEEVHVGDRIQHRGNFGRVVVVSDGDHGEFSPGYEDYSGTERGLVICDDDGSLTFLSEPDEMLEFIDRE